MTVYHNNTLHKPYANNLYTNPPLVSPSSTHPECASFYKLPLSALLHVVLHSCTVAMVTLLEYLMYIRWLYYNWMRTQQMKHNSVSTCIMLFEPECTCIIKYTDN